MRLTSRVKGTEHHVTIPRHQPLRLGTLSAILADVASYLETSRSQLAESLRSIMTDGGMLQGRRRYP